MKSAVFFSGLLILLVVLLSSQSGCANLTQTPSEHEHTYETVIYHDSHLLPDDWDMLWEMDRPTRLSRWLVTY
jgi:hypothetical protein